MLKRWLGFVSRKDYDTDLKVLNEIIKGYGAEVEILKKENADLKGRLRKAEENLPKPGQWSLERFVGAIMEK